MSGNASFKESFNVAIGSLRGSKLRSFLTLLGIILATATLIAVMSVIRGMDEYMAKNITDLGVEGFRVRRVVMIGTWEPKKWLEMQKKNPQLNREEFDFVKSKVQLTSDLGMETGKQCSVTVAGDRLQEVELRGVTSNIAVMNNTQTDLGRFISDNDDGRHLMVAFIGSELKDRFFANVDPIGKFIQVDGRPFEVIGVAKQQGSAFGQSRDKFLMIPIETYFKMNSARQGLGYTAKAMDRPHLEQAQDEVRSLLRAYRHLRPGQDDTFGIYSSDSFVALWDRMTGAIAATAIAIVSVFMVVGGVVIMNIMLAVVTERTMEIGIRKSLGARRRDIMNQFLVESAVLSGMGGLIGVVLAWMTAIIVRNTTSVPMSVPPAAIFVGVALSCVVGLFFGIYPAHQAAKLDPIEALRAER